MAAGRQLKSSAKHFITFGDGSRQHWAAGRRLVQQARKCGGFKTFESFDWQRICRELPDFARRYGHLLRRYYRGFGYWIWKALIIRNRLEILPEEEILVYADAGCELDHFARADYLSWFGLMDETDIAALVLEKNYTGRVWTNSFMRESLPWAEKFIEEPQIATTVMSFRNVKTVRNLVAEWEKLCLYKDAELMIDRPPQSEDPIYREHRHDQALFSLLIYRAAAQKQINLRLWSPVHWSAKSYPLKGIRNKTGISMLRKPVWLHKILVKAYDKYLWLVERIRRNKTWTARARETALL